MDCVTTTAALLKDSYYFDHDNVCRGLFASKLDEV